MEVEQINGNGNGNGTDDDGGKNRLRGWHHSSRIIRVSRASGGKDRHSKVLTSKGLRDRRVRLSVTTAIQFYDLQDRLGYDQPSKAVEWLIKAASDSIAELPSLNGCFPDTPKQLSDEKRGNCTELWFESAEMEELDNQQNQNQQISLSKSSSTSETSKGSGLSLARSDVRVNRAKARERARERAAKEKEKEYVNPNSQNSSFTELLTGGSTHQNPNSGEHSLVQKAAKPCNSAPMDYFRTGIFGASSSRNHHSSEFSGQINLGNSYPAFNVTGDNQPELQQFPFVPDNLISVSQSGGGEYNLDFSISSRLAGFNRGTLQSNTPSLLPQLQRFSSIDGSNISFISTTASAVPPVENHHHQNHHPHQFSSGFDGSLQLYYGDGSRHANQKGKGKN